MLSVGFLDVSYYWTQAVPVSWDVVHFITIKYMYSVTMMIGPVIPRSQREQTVLPVEAARPSLPLAPRP